MLPDRVSNPGPLTYESGALPIALRGPAVVFDDNLNIIFSYLSLKPYVVTAHLNRLDETVQMRGHNIGFVQN